MEFKDYYDILGVKPEAETAAIKSAYRKLARKYHPDVSKEAGAEDKFKAVNEAYEVLKDKEKRAAYDQVRSGGYRDGDRFRPPPDWAQDFGRGGGAEADAGFSDFFESLFGRAAESRQQARARRGQNIRAGIAIDLALAYAGGSTRVVLQDQNGAERVLEVKIPAGIESGKTIRLGGQGHPGFGGAPAGDLLLEISVRDGPRFKLDGRNVRYILLLAPWEAALGAGVAVPTLGGTVELNIPPGSQSGRVLRLKGRGLPGTPPGDQLVALEVRLPEPKSDRDQSAYEKFREAFKGFSPRD